MKFKILALRINSPFALQKNLEPRRLYKFTNDVTFLDIRQQPLEIVREFRDIKAIRQNDYFPSDLFNIGEGKDKIDVSISAILGRNGAGKSSLLETLYLMVFCISELKRFVNQRNLLSARIDQGMASEIDHHRLRSLNDLLTTAGIELYYQIGDDFFLIRNHQQRISEYKLVDGNWEVVKYDSELFFYTICVNYTQYGLNSRGEYFWLRSLFHKNDGYRTPIVLNPMRTEGNIDMNLEAHLAQTRILTNLSHQKINSTSLIDDKSIESVYFLVRPALIGNVEENSLHHIYEETRKQNDIDLVALYMSFIAYFGDTRAQIESDYGALYLQDYFSHRLDNENPDRYDPEREYRFRPERIGELLALYIVGKMVKICNKYSEFRKHANGYLEGNKQPSFWMVKDSKAYVKQLLEDQSHVTLKLKQAVNALKHGYLDRMEWGISQDPEYLDMWAYRSNWTFQKLQDNTNAAFVGSRYKKKIRAQFVPTAFFSPEIQVSDGKRIFSFSQLSSGEQQLLHSTHSIIYHLLNLDSRKGEREPYQFVNLVLDEIELYYHPKYQRDFIAFLLAKLTDISLTLIKGINIIFSTHSPFILSDIPHHNVLRLEKGRPIVQPSSAATFGANIHDMLADSFFLEEGLIGKFAEQTINKIISKIEGIRILKELEVLQRTNQKTDQYFVKIRELSKILFQSGMGDQTYYQVRLDEEQNQKLASLISMIGEPVIRFKLEEMYHDILDTESSDKARTRRHILNLMRENNIDKEEL